jgi:ribonuclease P protein subunit POP4
MITARTLLRHELIGLNAKVLRSKNAANVGIEGKITDETLNTLTIQTNSREKKIFKADVVLLIELPDRKKVQVDGALLVGRPWERIKKKFPRY